MSFNYSGLFGKDSGETQKTYLYRLKRIRGYLVLLILALTTLGSCKDEMELFKITRLPTFSFSLDNLNKQTATEVRFSQGKSVLHSYPTGEKVLYSRSLMQVTGTSQAGKNYTLSIEFDLPDQENLVGIYKPTYEVEVGGIYSFNYLEEASPGVYKSYNLDPQALDQTYFRIQKQNSEEMLILGDFLAKLQNDQNPSDKIVFYQGTFNDIFYGAQ